MRALWELALACVRYRASVRTHVRQQLSRWSEVAEAIEDESLRRLALEKLSREGFNAEAAAMLATGAPAAQRARTVEAIVALEVLYDYLDGRSETSAEAPGEVFAPYIAALAGGMSERAGPGEDPYAQRLAGAACEALADLPAIAAVRARLESAGVRGARAQAQLHHDGVEELLSWAQSASAGSGLQPREFVAGAAASVLAVHALIAAAARSQTTAAEASAIARLYLSIAAIATLLDGTVDHEQDADGHGCVALYEDPQELTVALAALTRKALPQTRAMRGGSHHEMILAGLIAYYSTDPGAQSAFAAPVLAALGGELGGSLTPALAVMRVWRLARRARAQRAGRTPASLGEPWPSS